MQFSDIPGNQGLKQRLISGIQKNRVAHSIMLLGSEGWGGLPLAIAYAQYLNCKNRTESDSCGKCNSCIQSDDFVHPNVRFTYPCFKINAPKEPIDADFAPKWRESMKSNPYISLSQWLQAIKAGNYVGDIYQTQCKDVRNSLKLRAEPDSFKVRIIWWAEKLTNNGNRLLKSLEEPPERTVFILIGHDKNKILQTILSRTQIYPVQPIPKAEIAAFLGEKRILDPNQRERFAVLAQGNLNTALSLADGNDPGYDKLLKDWLRSCIMVSRRLDGPAANRLVKIGGEFKTMGRDSQKQFLNYALFICRETLVMSSGRSIIEADEDLKLLDYLSKTLDLDQMLYLTERLNEMSYHIERNGHPVIQFMSLSFKVIELFAGRIDPVKVALLNDI